jgi:hypothetical protein
MAKKITIAQSRTGTMLPSGLGLLNPTPDGVFRVCTIAKPAYSVLHSLSKQAIILLQSLPSMDKGKLNKEFYYV